MFTINNIQDSAGKPVRTLGYSPYMAMMINPWSAIDKYSDDTTDVDGIASPDVNNVTYVASSTSAVMGIPSTMTNLFPANNTVLDDFFSFSNRILANNAYKYYKFLNFFNKYRAFKYLTYYSILKDATRVSESTITQTTGGCLRELDSSTVIMLYPQTTSILKAMAGTIASDGTISWGTAVTIDVQASGTLAGSDFGYAVIGTSKFVVAAINNSTDDVAVNVCTVSGNTITVGTASILVTTSTNYALPRVCKLDTDKFAIIYQDSAASKYYAAVATVSGTTPTWGTPVEITGMDTLTAKFQGLEQNGTDAFTFLYTYSGDATLMKAVACTVSGTVPTIGSAVTVLTANGAGSSFNSSLSDAIYNLHIKKTATNKFLVFALDSADVYYVNLFTISGTTVTAYTQVSTSSYDASMQVTAIKEQSADASYLMYGSQTVAFLVNISGTTVTLPQATTTRLVTASSVICVNVGAGMLTAEATYTSGMGSSYRKLAMVGSYCVYVATAGSITHYMTAPATATFEAYNDGTIIGSAFTCTQPFVLQTQSIQSSIMNKEAFLKIKNTTGSAVGMVIESVFCEVD